MQDFKMLVDDKINQTYCQNCLLVAVYHASSKQEAAIVLEVRLHSLDVSWCRTGFSNTT